MKKIYLLMLIITILSLTVLLFSCNSSDTPSNANYVSFADWGTTSIGYAYGLVEIDRTYEGLLIKAEKISDSYYAIHYLERHYHAMGNIVTGFEENIAIVHKNAVTFSEKELSESDTKAINETKALSGNKILAKFKEKNGYDVIKNDFLVYETSYSDQAKEISYTQSIFHCYTMELNEK